MRKGILFILLAGLKFIGCAAEPSGNNNESSNDDKWWDGLTEEWKQILIINQQFKQHHIDIFQLQHGYINRVKDSRDADYSLLNQSVHVFHSLKTFSLGYADMFARAAKLNPKLKKEGIDLNSLATLDTLYMVNGPADLSPLKKFPHLKVLIMNNCGLDINRSQKELVLDLTPLKYLTELKILHCATPVLESIKPLEPLVNSEELHCGNRRLKSLAPLRKLDKLKSLSLGYGSSDVKIVSSLENLEALYLNQIKILPNLSKLKKLKILSIFESEMALINAKYRLTSIDFLKNLSSLEFLDLDNTSYRGSLAAMDGLQHLKAVTLPGVSSMAVQAFKKQHPNCVIINLYEYE